jgi:hypothetical protein
MDLLLHVIETYGLWVVFVCVILDQGGLPFPAYPPMIVTAGLAVDSNASLVPILLVATLGTLLADLLWFAGGRRFGATLLRLMCKLSLSADSCVGMTRRIYGRWGAPSLIVSKYIPGFAAVATTLAGETGTSLRGLRSCANRAFCARGRWPVESTRGANAGCRSSAAKCGGRPDGSMRGGIGRIFAPKRPDMHRCVRPTAL